jgi:hypothetical protein
MLREGTAISGQQGSSPESRTVDARLKGMALYRAAVRSTLEAPQQSRMAAERKAARGFE